MRVLSTTLSIVSTIYFESAFAAESEISKVILYPGVATVERVASISADTAEVKFSCLPLTFESDSVRIDADDGIRFGDVNVKTVPAALAPHCGVGPQSKQIRELEDKRAQIEAEKAGHEIALSYVKSLSAPAAGAGTSGAIEAAADSIRKTVMTALIKQQQLTRQLEDIDSQLLTLGAQNQTGAKKSAQYREVSVRVTASRSGKLRLNYQVNGPGWVPSYRATLDSQSNKVTIERLALVSQASGEDWKGVQLKLSTALPQQNVAPPSPYPWQISVLPQERQRETMAGIAAAPAPALAMLEDRRGVADRARESQFDATVFNGTFSTEFSVAQRVDLSSNDQRTTLSLGTQVTDARIFSRIVASQSASAFVMAEIQRPEGVWIRGDLQLFRDNALVGNSTWNVGAEPAITLAFGRDESLRVLANPEKKNTGTAGFTGGKQSRTYNREFTIENLRKTVANIEFIDAAPVAINSEIEVQSKFTPEPTAKDWKAMRGVNAWTQSLKVNESATFKTDYTVTYPKDARVVGLR